MDRRVAIIGASYRLPGTTKKTFWKDLLNGKDLVTEVDDSRWAKNALWHPDKKHPGTSYSFSAGSIGDVAQFDADFFGISPREAAQIDPQQRLLLEMSWESIESAGVAPSTLAGSNCGVYIGIASVDYAYRLADDMSAIDMATATGNASSIASNRISYMFDLKGPSISMDTACSSSMVAFHQACRAIQTGEVDMALTGGISLHLHPYGFMIFSKATMLSPTGRCHVFDADGDGYVRSEGGGVFYLKEYEQAVKDGDPILAVVAGSAVNTDGNNSGLTIPNVAAQTALMKQAYQQANIDVNDIDYLEAHGTGTSVGDPIETNAIGKALGQKRKAPLLIGSVKSNVGHLETASGVAGLAKALGVIENRVIPATPSMKKPNPNIKFADWNIEVVTENHHLSSDDITVGVNSFGFGGANAHVILQSPPQQNKTKSNKTTLQQPVPVRLTARTPDAVKAAAHNYQDFIEASSADLYDIAWSSFYKQEHHHDGVIAFAKDKKQLAVALAEFAASGEADSVHVGVKVANATGPVFAYSGNGCQWDKMGKQLLKQSATFKAAIEKVDALFEPLAGFSLLAELNGDNGLERYVNTEIAQPALFALQVGLTELLKELGVTMTAVVGHSVGEVAAAWASGALSLKDAVQVIYYRSLYQGKTAGIGGMTAVGLNGEQTEELLIEYQLDQVTIAGFNSSRGVTVAGDVTQLDILETRLEADEVFYRRLDLNYAFHSESMDVIESDIIASLNSISPQKTNVPFISTVTGAALAGTELDSTYWWKNVRQPVQFESAVNALVESGQNIFIDIGAHPVLRSYLRDALRNADTEGLIISTLERDTDQLDTVLNTLAQLILSGCDYQQTTFFADKGEFVQLPAYPWQHQRYWQEPSSESQGLLARRFDHPLLGYPLAQQTSTWENLLDTVKYPWLSEHVVGNVAIFPGAGYIELLLAAMAQSSVPVLDIEEIEILNPLVLSEQSKVVRLHIAENGEMKINTREHVTTDTAWMLNVKARLTQQSLGLQLTRTAPELPIRPVDFTKQQHIALAKEIGLDYGPTFQAISHGWINQQEVIGVFEIPESIQQCDDFHLHPGILDSSFQLFIQFLADKFADVKDMAFVPVRVGRIQLRADNNDLPYLTRAVLKRSSPHSFTADFELFKQNGEALAVLTDVRFKAVRLKTQRSHPISELDYHLTALSMNKASVLPDDVVTLINTVANNFVEKPYGDLYENELEPLLDSLVRQFSIEALTGFADEKSLIAEQQLSEQAIRLVNSLVEDGAASEVTQGQWQLVDDSPLTGQQIWNALLREYPDYFELINVIGRFGLHLPELLQDASAIELEQLLPLSDYANLVWQIHGHQVTAMLGEQLADFTAELSHAIRASQRFSVLEISAKTPRFANWINAATEQSEFDYTFASLNETAVEAAQQHLENAPYSNVIDLGDISQACQADLILLHLDDSSVENSRSILKLLPQLSVDGAIVVLLGHHPAWWLDQTYSLYDSWWLSEEQTSQLSKQQWLELAADFNYELIETDSLNNISGSFLAAMAVPQQSKSSYDETQYLIVSDADKQELAESLLAQLQSVGHHVEIVNYKSSKDLKQALTNLDQELAAKAVFIQGMGQQGVEQQLLRTTLLTDFVQLAQSVSIDVDCYVFTQGVSQLYLPTEQKSAQFADAALWGFARTLMNESTAAVKLIDLPFVDNDKQPLSAIVDLLQASSAEDEFILTEEGHCLAPRLYEKQTQQADFDPEVQYSLGFHLPGQLHNLVWLPKPKQALADDQLDIEVKATGLNFRDVMYALGLLSDEAIENGFSGPTLGLEFAGVVKNTGAAVTDFNVGDRVVGFSSASFSNRIQLTNDAITHIPEGMSFEAAATIPTTFFTVYYSLKHLAMLEEDEKVLIHGAAGGVGIAAIQIAQYFGAEIYATAGTDQKRDFLKLMGVEHIYDSRSLTFAEQILADMDEGQGIDVVINSLAGEAIHQNLRVLKPFGRFIELGKRDFYENTAIGLRPFRNNLTYFGVDSDQLMKERPALTKRLFKEMMQLFEQGELHPLPYSLFEADQVVSAFRYMQQARQIGKVVVTYSRPIEYERAKLEPSQQTLALDNNAQYLVTGGLAGFGLKTAEWLVEKGARHLILISRSGPKSAEAKAAIEQMSQQGVTVNALACDVTSQQDMAALFEQFHSESLPIKGVVHAATVIEDGLITNQTAEQIENVYLPKIQGAQILHDLTKSMSLDLFVLFSSATTLFGNPGQSSYVAANHWMEALASYRANNGLPATCVRWGAIDDVGFLARNEQIKAALSNRMGGDPLMSDTALGYLEKMLLSGEHLSAVMELDWSVLSRNLPNATANKYREIALTSGQHEQAESSADDIAELIKTMSSDELFEFIAASLKHELSSILLIAEDKIDINRSLFDIGLDSLMGVELMTVIETRFDIQLSVMALSESPTLAKLTQRIVDKLHGSSENDDTDQSIVNDLAGRHGVKSEIETN